MFLCVLLQDHVEQKRNYTVHRSKGCPFHSNRHVDSIYASLYGDVLAQTFSLLQNHSGHRYKSFVLSCLLHLLLHPSNHLQRILICKNVYIFCLNI